MKAKKFLALAMSASMILSSVQVMAGTPSNERTQREIENAAVARDAATQGMILLENHNNVLPLKTKKVALFGYGAVRTVRGGFGSGDPFNGGLSGTNANWAVDLSDRYHVNIADTLKENGWEITNQAMLDEYAAEYDANHEKAGYSTMSCFYWHELHISDEQLDAAAKDTDTAIYVLSRNAGEGADRVLTDRKTVQGQTFDIGDYNLTDEEKENLARVAKKFDKVVVVLNVGGMMDTNFFSEIEGLDSLLLMGQAGQEGASALMDVLSGAVTPSGKTISTWGKKYQDYPASSTFANFDKDSMHEYYNEGIYVGYRYFDTFGITPEYEFGYGLSYTDFDIKVDSVTANVDEVTVKATVKNVGKEYSGKEVVQVYFSAPDSVYAEKEYQQLAGYAKTDELAPGESQTVTIKYSTDEMAYFNEDKAAYILDAGSYYVRVGNSSRNTHIAAKINLDKAATVKKVTKDQMPVVDSKLNEWSKYGEVPYTYDAEESEMDKAPVIKIKAKDIKTVNEVSPYVDETVTTYTTDPTYKAQMPYEKVKVFNEAEVKDVTLLDVYNGKASVEQLVTRMTVQELAKINCGSGWGVADENNPIVGGSSETVPGAAGETIAYPDYKIPSIVSADGPGGVRVTQQYTATNVNTGEKITYYQFATAWPVHYVLAQSWDPALVEKLGKAYAVELAELNITTLLGPSLNIWRDPMCGRNFEYFGEDPVVAGTMASALVKGVQSKPGIYACLKHYAVNNQETNRSGSDSVLSQRALREIYLKGFEIAIKESQPASIMTSYNKVNSVPTDNSYDLNTNLARGEWGFTGTIMTDWNGSGGSTVAMSMHAGNDLRMPGGSSNVDSILSGATDLAPTFAANGQVATSVNLLYGFLRQESASWGEFQLAADGKVTADAVLGDGYTATVDPDTNQILVNGEVIYTTLQSSGWFGPSTWRNPLTTALASVSEDGKVITYKGNYPSNNIICLGDIQKCAINNILAAMGSRDMERLYKTTAVSFTGSRADLLVPYQTIVKSDIVAPVKASVTLNKKALVVKKGKSVKVVATIKNADNATIKIANKKIANFKATAIKANGKVTITVKGLKKGKTTLKVSAGSASAKIKVTVK